MAVWASPLARRGRRLRGARRPRPARGAGGLRLDLRGVGITAIIWATGFAFDFGWLQVGALDARAADAAWDEMRERLLPFTTPRGWEGPNELLLTAGHRAREAA